MNVILNLRDGETINSIIARAKEYHVIILSQMAFARFLRKDQGVITITFASPTDVVRKGVERLKAALL